MYKAIQSEEKIELGQSLFQERIVSESPDIESITISHTGYSGKLRVRTNEYFWYGYQNFENVKRHWNAFGICPYDKNQEQRIIAEINFDCLGENGRVQGVLAEDIDTQSLVILHRGRFNVSKGGSTIDRFFDYCSKEKSLEEVQFEFNKSGRTTYVRAVHVTDLESSDFLDDIAHFVGVVKKYKRLVEMSNTK